MTRPLRYDDSFTNIINEKIHEKFLGIFTIKVQSTAFSQRLNLQRSLMVCSLFDFILGIIIIFTFFRSIKESKESFTFFIENFLLIIGVCFGCVGMDASTNLRKLNTKIYKNWRVFITFAFPFFEMINNFSFLCHYRTKCDKFPNLIFTLALFLVNLYFSKIAWSFYIRLEKGHELLIIHGKYLEKMMNDESYKISDVKKYVPPETLKDQELSLFKNTSSPGGKL